MMMKTFLLFVASVAVFSQNAASFTTRDENLTNKVVESIRDLIQDLEGGISGSELRNDIDGLGSAIDQILTDFGVNVSDEAKVQAIINSVGKTLYQVYGVNPTINEFTRAVSLLSGLADLLEKKTGSADQNELADILEAIKLTAADIIAIVNENGDQEHYAYVPDVPPTDDNTEAVRGLAGPYRRKVKRGTCIGWCWWSKGRK